MPTHYLAPLPALARRNPELPSGRAKLPSVSGRNGRSRAFGACPLITPKILESLRTQFRIAHRVRDVLVPKVLLNRARVLALAG